MLAGCKFHEDTDEGSDLRNKLVKDVLVRRYFLFSMHSAAVAFIWKRIYIQHLAWVLNLGSSLKSTAVKYVLRWSGSMTAEYVHFFLIYILGYPNKLFFKTDFPCDENLNFLVISSIHRVWLLCVSFIRFDKQFSQAPQHSSESYCRNNSFELHFFLALLLRWLQWNWRCETKIAGKYKRKCL